MRTPKRHGRPKGGGRHLKGLFKRCQCVAPNKSGAQARKIWSDCPHDWYLTHRGTRRRIRADVVGEMLKLERAQEKARELRVQIDKERGQTTYGRKRPTFEQAAREYVTAEYENNPKRRRHRVKVMEQAFDVLCRTQIAGQGVGLFRMGDKLLDTFKTRDIESFRERRRTVLREQARNRAERAAKIAKGVQGAAELPVSPEVPHAQDGEVGINRYLEILRAFFKWCIKKEYYRGESPFLLHGVSAITFTKEQRRKRRMVGDEEARLLAHAGPHLRDVTIGALDLGARRSELLSLQWSDIDFRRDGTPVQITFRAENTKTDEARTVPVHSARLQQVLKARRIGADGVTLPPTAYVFGNELGERVYSVKTAWRAACRRAGISGLTLHDLRREHGSRLVEGGVSVLTVSGLLGHAAVSTTDTYLEASKLRSKKEVQTYFRKQRMLTEPQQQNASPTASANAAEPTIH